MPNAALQAVLSRFAEQPGVSAQQMALLYGTLGSDAGLRQRLNQQAVSGELKQLALEPPATASLIGRYDKASGTVHLPPAAFANGDALRGTLGLQSLSAEFAQRTWQAGGQTHSVNQDMLDNLHATFNGSPRLAEQTKLAVREKHLQYIGLLPASMTAGASYDGAEPAVDGSPKGIKIPPRALQSDAQGIYDTTDMTFVLAHEVQHGFNDAARDNARDRYLQAIARQAAAPGAVHDYTDELRDYLRAQSEDEARAQIAGWNALLSREQQLKPTADIHHMLHGTGNDRMLDFVMQDPAVETERTIARPGISFNADHSLSPTEANIAAIGRHFFDRPSRLYAQPGERPLGIGESPAQSTNYRNYHGNWAIEQIIAAEDRAHAVRPPGSPRPQIAIGMAGLGLKEDLLEMEGMNLGQNKTPRAYLDTSQTPHQPGHFHHTQDASMGHAHQHVPVTAPSSPEPPGERPAARPPPLPEGFARPLPPAGDDMREPHHPGHGAYRRALDAVQRMETERGIRHGTHSEILAARLAAEAAEHRQGITHVKMQDGQIQAIARYSAFDEGKRFGIATEQALSDSIEASSRRWLAATSPHYAHAAPGHARHPEQVQALQALNPADRQLFAALRERLPASVADEAVAQVLVQAKQNGIGDVSRLDKVVLHGERIHVLGTTPGFRASIDLAEQAPPLQESVNQLQENNRQQQAQQEQAQQEQMQQHTRGMSR